MSRPDPYDRGGQFYSERLDGPARERRRLALEPDRSGMTVVYVVAVLLVALVVAGLVWLVWLRPPT